MQHLHSQFSLLSIIDPGPVSQSSCTFSFLLHVALFQDVVEVLSRHRRDVTEVCEHNSSSM